MTDIEEFIDINEQGNSIDNIFFTRLRTKEASTKQFISFFQDRPSEANIFSGFTTILGMTGSGKTNTLAVLCEEMLEIAQPPNMCIFDIEGEYKTFKDYYKNFEIVGNKDEDSYCDINLDWDSEYDELTQNQKIKKYISLSLQQENKKHIIFDFSSFDDKCRASFILKYLTELMDIKNVLRKSIPQDKSIFINYLVFEEGGDLIPRKNVMKDENVNRMKEQIKQLVMLGRKRAIYGAFLSQKTQIMDLAPLSQSKTFILHKTTIPQDIGWFSGIANITLSEGQVKFPNLQTGEVIIRSGDLYEQGMIRMRKTKHLSKTVKFDDQKAKISDDEINKIIERSLYGKANMVT